MNKQKKELLISFKKNGYTHLLCDQFTDGICLFELVYGETKKAQSFDYSGGINLRSIFGKYEKLTSIDELLMEEMMNKYQEALNKLYNDACGYEYQKSSIKEKELLQELVDKVTPKKPLNMIITQYDLSIGDCPICKGTVVQGNGCAKCLQAIDWSKDE